MTPWERRQQQPARPSKPWERYQAAAQAKPPPEPPTTARERARALIVGGANIIPGMDELRATVRGAWRAMGDEEYGPAKAEELAKARAELERVKRRTPGGYYGGMAAAGVLTAPLIPGAAAATLPGRVLQGAATGGATAAAQGFGEGEGGLVPRLEEARKQGTTGAVLGGVLGPAASALGTGARYVARSVSDLFSPEEAARQTLARAVREGGGDPAAVIAADLAAGAKNVTVGDVSKPVRDLVRDVAAAPNPSQTGVNEFFNLRQAGKIVPGVGVEGGQFNRATTKLRALTGTGTERGLLAADDLIEQRKVQAGPLFQSALTFPAHNNPDIAAAFQRVKKTSVGKDVMRDVKLLWSVENPGVPYPKSADYVPNMPVLKMMKELLDDKVEELYGGTKPQTTMARAVEKLRDDFRDTLARENTDYGKALAIYSGKTALTKAIKAGLAAGSGDPDKVALGLKTFKTQGEQHAYRLGAVTALENQLGTASAIGEMTDHTRKLLTINGMKRVGSLIPNRASHEFWDNYIDAEMRQSQTSAARGGSQTQPRGEVAKEVEVPVPKGIPSTTELLLMGTEKARQYLTRGKRGVLGRQLIRTDEDALRLLQELNQPRPPIQRTPGKVGKMAAIQLAGPVELDPFGLLGAERPAGAVPPRVPNPFQPGPPDLLSMEEEERRRRGYPQMNAGQGGATRIR